MRTRICDSFEWPMPYPNIPINQLEVKKGFFHVWEGAVTDIELLEAAEFAAKNNVRARMTIEQQQAIFRIQPHASWLYFMHSEDSGLVKIGKTTHPTKRVACLKTMSPVPLTCIAMVRAHDFHEKMLHKALESYRAHGEWFRYEGEVVEVIQKARKDGIRPVQEFICLKALDNFESIV